MTKAFLSMAWLISYAFLPLQAQAEGQPAALPQSEASPLLQEIPLTPGASFLHASGTAEEDTNHAVGNTTYLDGSLQLRRTARQHAITAGVTYALSGALLGIGTVLVVPQECTAKMDYDDRNPCSGMSIRQINGSIMLSVAAGSVFSIALPLHRSSNQHRRMADQMQLGQAQDISMLQYQGVKLTRLGRNYLIGGAALALTSLAALGASSALGDGVTGLAVSAGTGFSAVILSVTGARIHLRGKRLTRRGEAQAPLQTLIAPTFYGDGAGLSLFMGF